MKDRIGVVVDTNIVVDSFNEQNDPDLKERCNRILASFLMTDRLMFTIDQPEGFGKGHKIINEYRKHLGGERDFELYLIGLEKKEKINVVKPIRDSKLDKQLDAIHFHEPEDRVFIYTALAADKIVVTEDSDFGIGDDDESIKRHEFFLEELGMEINNSECFITKYF